MRHPRVRGSRVAVVVDELGAAIVRVTTTGVPEGVTLCGSRVQVEPAGAPEQLSDTSPLNPFNGATVTDIVPLCSVGTVSEVAEALSEKSAGGGGGGGRLILKAAAAAGLFAYPLATATPCTVSDEETVIGPA